MRGDHKVGIAICRDAFFDEFMPFGYYSVPRSRYLKDTIHGMSNVKAYWTNGYYTLACNSAEGRAPSEWEPDARFPGWAGVIDPWGRVLSFVDRDGNDETMVVVKIGPEALQDRRNHPNFTTRELRPALYQLAPH